MAENRPGGEPTEEPTPRRLRQARERGQIARSAELTSAAAFCAGVGALAAFSSVAGTRLAATMRAGIERAVAGGDLGLVAGPALEGALLDAAALALPVVGAAFLAALVVGGLQAGGLLTLEPLLPKAERLNPFAGAKRIFSAKAFATLLRALVKLTVVGGVAYATVKPHLGELLRLAGASPSATWAWTGALALRLAWRVALAFAVIGAADYLWERRSWLRELRMTRQEVEREHKESEGDPRHKAERQRLHRDLLRQQIIEAVRTADCVIVNPTHLAVALRYDENSMGAPTVVAKGERLWAAQIREVARAHGVPIYRDVALARALHELELGDEIPEELYDAVAEVLRFAMRQEGNEHV